MQQLKRFREKTPSAREMRQTRDFLIGQIEKSYTIGTRVSTTRTRLTIVVAGVTLAAAVLASFLGRTASTDLKSEASNSKSDLLLQIGIRFPRTFIAVEKNPSGTVS